MLNCTLDTPLRYDGTAPKNYNDAFSFSHLTCTGDLETTQNYIATTTGDFYISKVLTYGDVLFLAFLIPTLFILLTFAIRQILMHKFNG